MAIVQFSFGVKYDGVHRPPHEPFQVSDEDYAELVAAGAHTIVAPAKKEGNDSAPPQGTSSGEGGEGETLTPPDSEEAEETPKPENSEEPSEYPIFKGNGWFELSDHSKVHGSPEKAAEAEAKLHE